MMICEIDSKSQEEITSVIFFWGGGGGRGVKDGAYIIQ